MQFIPGDNSRLIRIVPDNAARSLHKPNQKRTPPCLEADYMLNVGVELIGLHSVANLRFHDNREIVDSTSNEDVHLATEFCAALRQNSPCTSLWNFWRR